MADAHLDGRSTVTCAICGGPATRTAITAGGDDLTPATLCDANVCKASCLYHEAHDFDCLDCRVQAKMKERTDA